MVQLLRIIKNYKHENGEDLCCLIFTQRRFTAKVIYHLINDISRSHSEYKHIKAEFMVGNNSNPYKDTREALYIHKQSKKVSTFKLKYGSCFHILLIYDSLREASDNILRIVCHNFVKTKYNNLGICI